MPKQNPYDPVINRARQELREFRSLQGKFLSMAARVHKHKAPRKDLNVCRLTLKLVAKQINAILKKYPVLKRQKAKQLNLFN